MKNLNRGAYVTFNELADKYGVRNKLNYQYLVRIQLGTLYSSSSEFYNLKYILNEKFKR